MNELMKKSYRVSCPVCSLPFKSHQLLYEHCQEFHIHEDRLKEFVRDFSTYDDFEKFKVRLEEETGELIMMPGSKPDEHGLKMIFFRCKFSHIKKGILSRCPAFMNVEVDKNGTVVVKGFGRHLDHEKEEDMDDEMEGEGTSEDEDLDVTDLAVTSRQSLRNWRRSSELQSTQPRKVQCGVRCCEYDSDTMFGGTAIAMFELPSDRTMRDEWLQVVPELLNEVPSRRKICQVHFAEGKPTTDNPIPTMLLSNEEKNIKEEDGVIELSSSPESNSGEAARTKPISAAIKRVVAVNGSGGGKSATVVYKSPAGTRIVTRPFVVGPRTTNARGGATGVMNRTPFVMKPVCSPGGPTYHKFVSAIRNFGPTGKDASPEKGSSSAATATITESTPIDLMSLLGPTGDDNVASGEFEDAAVDADESNHLPKETGEGNHHPKETGQGNHLSKGKTLAEVLRDTSSTVPSSICRKQVYDSDSNSVAPTITFGGNLSDPACNQCMSELPLVRRSLARLEQRVDNMMSMVKMLVNRSNFGQSAVSSLYAAPFYDGTNSTDAHLSGGLGDEATNVPVPTSSQNTKELQDPLRTSKAEPTTPLSSEKTSVQGSGYEIRRPLPKKRQRSSKSSKIEGKGPGLKACPVDSCSKSSDQMTTIMVAQHLISDHDFSMDNVKELVTKTSSFPWEVVENKLKEAELNTQPIDCQPKNTPTSISDILITNPLRKRAHEESDDSEPESNPELDEDSNSSPDPSSLSYNQELVPLPPSLAELRSRVFACPECVTSEPWYNMKQHLMEVHGYTESRYTEVRRNLSIANTNRFSFESKLHRNEGKSDTVNHASDEHLKELRNGDASASGSPNKGEVDPASLLNALFAPQPVVDRNHVKESNVVLSTDSQAVRRRVCRALLLYGGSEFTWKEFKDNGPRWLSSTNKNHLMAALQQLLNDGLLHQEDDDVPLLSDDCVLQKEQSKKNLRPLRKYDIDMTRYINRLSWSYDTPEDTTMQEEHKGSDNS